AALVVRIAALSILAPIWEVPGAIAALALATLPLAISVSVICIRQFGVDPSVFSIVSGHFLRRLKTPATSATGSDDLSRD
ncbi:MAG: hypothetical protein P4L98_19165, partial [Ancalomicrobiaceae bacterium]|nr:hypothetical protein [Ancalomicrobiaceae bacterium]